MVARASGPTGSGFKRAARGGAGRGSAFTGQGRRVLPVRGAGRRPGGAGRPACPRPPGGLIPICLLCGRERASVGAPCASREHPDYIYQRVVSLEAPTTPSSITQSDQSGPFGGTKAAFRPCLSSSRVPAPCFAALRAARTPDHRPDQGDPGLSGPIRPRMRAQESPGCSRGAQGAPPRHRPAYLPRSERCGGFKGGRPRRPGGAGTAILPPRPAPTGPPRSAAPDRPAGSPACLRCPLEHPPSETPRPGDHLRPAPTCAVAARLDLRSARRRAGPAGRSPLPPSLPA